MKKVFICTFLLIYSLTGLSLAQYLEPREFFNADRTKSFKATLVDYDSKEQMVAARPVCGPMMKFKLDVLSTKDQAYVKEKAATTLLSRKIRVRFEEWTGDTDTTKEGLVRSSKSEKAYDISFSQIEDIDLPSALTMEYVLFIKRGQEKGASKTEQITGSKNLNGMLDSSTYTVRTDVIETERYYRKVKARGGG